MSSPASQVLLGRSDSPPSVPQPLRFSLAVRYHVVPLFRSGGHGTRRPPAWGWSQCPRHRFQREDDGASQVPGEPLYERALLLDPGGPAGPCHGGLACAAFRICPHRRRPRVTPFGADSHGPSACCLRFAVGVAPDHARLATGPLARLWPGGIRPRWAPLSGFKVTSVSPFLPSQALPGARAIELSAVRRGPGKQYGGEAAGTGRLGAPRGAPTGLLRAPLRSGRPRAADQAVRIPGAAELLK